MWLKEVDKLLLLCAHVLTYLLAKKSERKERPQKAVEYSTSACHRQLWPYLHFEGFFSCGSTLGLDTTMLLIELRFFWYKKKMLATAMVTEPCLLTYYVRAACLGGARR